MKGERYQRTGRPPWHVRWGQQPGSVSLLDHTLSIQVPRVRDRVEGREIPLESYARLQVPRQEDAGLLRRLLLGLSDRRYRECAPPPRPLPRTRGEPEDHQRGKSPSAKLKPPPSRYARRYARDCPKATEDHPTLVKEKNENPLASP